MTLQTFYSAPIRIFSEHQTRNEVELGMLTQHQVVDFLILLFVLHQQWTCAFHCPKKSLNIPLLHVLVIILDVFFIELIHNTVVILAAKLILH